MDPFRFLGRNNIATHLQATCKMKWREDTESEALVTRFLQYLVLRWRGTGKQGRKGRNVTDLAPNDETTGCGD